MSKHAIFVSLPAYSHTRTLYNFARDLVDHDKGLIISFLIHVSQFQQFQKIATETGADNSRLRLISVGSIPPPGPAMMFDMMSQINEIGLAVVKDLLDGKAASATAASVETKPSMLLVDFFAHPVATAAQDWHLPNLHISLWFPSSPGALTMKFGIPDKHNGSADIVSAAGLTSLYCHEIFPATTPFPREAIAAMEGAARDVMQNSKLSIALPFDGALQPEATQALVDSLSKQGRQVFPIGFQFNRQIWTAEPSLDPKDKITKFLNASLEKNGPKSALFASLGTLFTPTKSFMMDAFIDAVVEAKLPCIFVQASPMISPEQSQEYAKKLEGVGISVPWADQAAVLKHPAVGYSLNHGGLGSCFEALYAGLPSIIWPFGGDQPCHAAFLAKDLKCAIELLQTRDNMIGGKLLNYPDIEVTASEAAVREEMKQVIARLTGAEGKALRQNAEKAGIAIRRAHDQDTLEGYDKFIAAFGRGIP